MENRGELLCVWSWGSDYNSYASFSPPPARLATYPHPVVLHHLSMPIGWRLVSTEQGVVVRNAFGKSLTAHESLQVFREIASFGG
jgi:hypothetical protein